MTGIGPKKSAMLTRLNGNRRRAFRGRSVVRYEAKSD